MRVLLVDAAVVWLFCSVLESRPAWSAEDVNEIVRRSVANNDANWKLAPQFSFQEHDLITKGGRLTDRTYDVVMIDGSPYNETIAVNGRRLSPAAQKRKDDKLRREEARRRAESPEAKRKRIAAYQQERRQDHALMREMIRAFQFHLAGTETVDGRECFRVDATPRPGYVPPTRDTKVLTAMRGTLWIDTREYEWVRVTASVFRPVAFGLFIAHVQPGTEFTLDEAPVAGNIWMPVHFRTRVRASVLFWSKNSDDNETYSDYRRTGSRTEADADRAR